MFNYQWFIVALFVYVISLYISVVMTRNGILCADAPLSISLINRRLCTSYLHGICLSVVVYTAPAAASAVVSGVIASIRVRIGVIVYRP